MFANIYKLTADARLPPLVEYALVPFCGRGSIKFTRAEQ